MVSMVTIVESAKQRKERLRRKKELDRVKRESELAKKGKQGL